MLALSIYCTRAGSGASMSHIAGADKTKRPDCAGRFVYNEKPEGRESGSLLRIRQTAGQEAIYTHHS